MFPLCILWVFMCVNSITMHFTYIHDVYSHNTRRNCELRRCALVNVRCAQECTFSLSTRPAWIIYSHPLVLSPAHCWKYGYHFYPLTFLLQLLCYNKIPEVRYFTRNRNLFSHSSGDLEVQDQGANVLCLVRALFLHALMTEGQMLCLHLVFKTKGDESTPYLFFIKALISSMEALTLWLNHLLKVLPLNTIILVIQSMNLCVIEFSLDKILK